MASATNKVPTEATGLLPDRGDGEEGTPEDQSQRRPAGEGPVGHKALAPSSWTKLDYPWETGRRRPRSLPGLVPGRLDLPETATGGR